MSEHNQGIDVDALAALVKQQAALIDQLTSKLHLQDAAAQPKLIDINDVRAQPDPKFRGHSMVYRKAAETSDPAQVTDGIEFRVVTSPAARQSALEQGWKGYAHQVFEPEPAKKGKAA
jgi:hypothetical protein